VQEKIASSKEKLKTFDQTEHGVCLIWKAGKPTESPAAASATSPPAGS